MFAIPLPLSIDRQTPKRHFDTLTLRHFLHASKKMKIDEKKLAKNLEM